MKQKSREPASVADIPGWLAAAGCCWLADRFLFIQKKLALLTLDEPIFENALIILTDNHNLLWKDSPIIKNDLIAFNSILLVSINFHLSIPPGLQIFLETARHGLHYHQDTLVQMHIYQKQIP